MSDRQRSGRNSEYLDEKRGNCICLPNNTELLNPPFYRSDGFFIYLFFPQAQFIKREILLPH